MKCMTEINATPTSRNYRHKTKKHTRNTFEYQEAYHHIRLPIEKQQQKKHLQILSSPIFHVHSSYNSLVNCSVMLLVDLYVCAF